MNKIILLTVMMTMGLVTQAQNMEGSWHGNLSVGNQSLGIAFHFNKDDKGQCTGKMDVPKQSALNIPVDVLFLTSDSVSLRIPALNVVYGGKLTKDTIKGIFRQYGMPFALDLLAGDLPKPNRPQEPAEPFDYKTEEVSFTNGMAHATFSGTLTYPVGYTGQQPVPVVLMVTGSGPQDRNEEVFGHKPFLIIADYLAKQGIASLRYDDRGVGKSTGQRAEATSKDFADDAKAGLDWLKNSGKFGKIGVLGHSEGGLIAFMLGAENATDFIVCMAAPGIKGDSLLAEQQNAILRSYGQAASRTVEQVRQQTAAQPKNVWLNYFLDYDPALIIPEIRIPVLALNGNRDMQVIAASNLTAIRKLLAKGNKKNLIKEYPDLNHLFQHCRENTALEYYHIEETCSPEVLQDIATWINDL